MAIIRTGGIVGQISGSIAGVTYSRNRGGAYVRNRAIPTKSTTFYAEQAKQRLGDISKLWGALTAAEQQAWKIWAEVNPVTNKLGDQIKLSGHQAYVQLNNVITNCGGTVISDPPVSAPPSGLLTLTPTYDIGTGNFQIAFTATPLGATEQLLVWMAIVDNPGVNYVNNLYKLIQVSSAAQASALDTETAAATRFGTLLVGQRVFYRVQVADNATGLRSQPIVANGTIVST